MLSWRQHPLVLSDGTVMSYETISEAALVAEFLRKELSVERVIQESNSKNTWNDAINKSEVI
jgi:hypothetical protein